MPDPSLSGAKPAAKIRRLESALGCTFASYYLMSGFFLTLFLLGYIWWPLAADYLSYIPWQGDWWRYMDWLLLGIFFVMSLLVMAGADLRTDVKIVLVGFAGGLVIEGWGTQTNIWHYFTAERPPLWIIPAWPFASLAIDRLVRASDILLADVGGAATGLRQHRPGRWLLPALYWLVFGSFYVLMLLFVAPTFDKSLTLAALFLVAFLILTPTDQRLALLTFAAGAGLGYFLELWGTTRQCWTYYTNQTPPLFAVLAHGMAAVAFWRSVRLMEMVLGKLTRFRKLPRSAFADQNQVAD